MKALGLTPWSPSIAFAAVQLGPLIFYEEIHNCSDRKIFTTMCFGVENCTGRGADFQKLFKGRWWWLRYLSRRLRPLQRALKSLWSHTLLQLVSVPGNFPSEAKGGAFQMKPAQVLSKLWSKRCSEFGIAACAEPGLTTMHTLSAKLLIWDMCSSHATVSSWFCLKTQVTSARCMCVCVCVCTTVSAGNFPVYH